MFVNCFDEYGRCLFSVPVREGVEAELLADHIYFQNELIDAWLIADSPQGAVVRY